jgi:ABC-type transport system involved in Fe-S cluster assembly, permease component
MGRDAYQRMLQELPFQHIADTPTVKYYTDWKVFEERFNLENSSAEDRIPSFIEHLDYNVMLGVGVRVLKEPVGVRVRVLGEEWDGDPRPMSLVGVHGKMHAYHAYRWSSGLLVEVDDNISFGDLVIASLGGNAYTGHHLMLKIGDGAKGRVLLVDYAGPSRGLKTLVVESTIGRGADVDLDLVALHSREHAVYSLTHMVVGDRSNVRSRVLGLGGAMSRVQVDYIVEGEGAKLSALASTVGREGTKSDIILNSVNGGPESEVTINARGAVLNKGYLALRGSAIVGEKAIWASSEIEIQVVIMGEEARGHAVPVLEIHSGDVAKANHAAGISHILEEQRFYLKSRGLSDEEASRLLVTGILEFSGLVEGLRLDPLKLLAV